MQCNVTGQVQAQVQLQLQLKVPWRDGTTHRVLSLREFMQWPAAQASMRRVLLPGLQGEARASDWFPPTNHGGRMSPNGREETFDLPPDCRHPVSPISASRDRSAARYIPGKLPVSQVTTAHVDR